MPLPRPAGAVFCALLLLPVSHSAADDVVWTRPQARRPADTALLPVTHRLGDPRAAQFVENRLARALCGPPASGWMLPDPARRRLVRRTAATWNQLDSLTARMWRSGGVDSIVARDVSRRLGVPAVLGICIEQWERRDRSVPDRMHASIHLQAALVDSNGIVLWRVAGAHTAATLEPQRIGMAQVAYRTNPEDWGVPWTGADPCWAPDFDRAVCELFARWRVSLPGASP
jgi:hypothetical protein